VAVIIGPGANVFPGDLQILQEHILLLCLNLPPLISEQYQVLQVRGI
jgi:hypothetical protein